MTTGDLDDTLVRLTVAALGGLAVGIERELSARAAGGVPRFAGVRTFFLLGLVGGVAAQLHLVGATAAGALFLAAVASLIVAAYVAKAARGEPDATTEVAAVLVGAAGVLAGLGQLPLASGVFAVTWLVLAEKGRIHGFVFRIEPEVLVAAARFSVLALVVLPLLPDESFGPEPGFRPRELWIFVLLFSGVSFAGFLALKALGPSRGYGLAGLLGGLVSSTAVTLSFSRESQVDTGSGRALALGVVAACTVVYARVVVLAAILNRSLAMAVVPYFAVPFSVGVVACFLLVRAKGEAAGPSAAKSPLRLFAAVKLAAVFQVFLYLVEVAQHWFGDSGILASAALMGLTDMDALTFSMVKHGTDDPQLRIAAQALAIGMLSNTLVKLALALVLGRGTYRRVAGWGLAALALAGVAAILYL